MTGYLTSAGLPIAVGDGACTMLAGWDPDATWWLSDVLSLTGPPEDWRHDGRRSISWTQNQQR